MAFSMAFKVEDCDEGKEEAKEKDFQFKCAEEWKIGEKSGYEPMAYEEDRESIDKKVNFAVVTLQDTDEVMVVASEWLSTDKKRCYWPPFKSTEKYLEAVKSNLEPSTGGKPWDILNVIFHAEYETYEEAVNNQVEQRALRNGLILYKVVTLQNSNELTVIPATWLNEEKTQCYWPPFKSPEKCTEAVKNRLEPPVTVEKPWEMLNIQVHMECVTYKQAMEKQKSLKEQRKRFSLKSPPFPVPVSALPQISPHDQSIPLYGVRGMLNRHEIGMPIPTSWSKSRKTSLSGTKRKLDHKLPDSAIDSPLATVTYKQAMEKQKSLKEQRKRFSLKSPPFPVPVSALPQISPHDQSIPLYGVRGMLNRHEIGMPIPTSWSKSRKTSLSGTKRKLDHELPDSAIDSPLATDMEIMLKAKKIMKRVTDNLVHTNIVHRDIISKINEMNDVIRKKAAIGIFGKPGEGKSSLLSAVLGKKDLLPSSYYGAGTACVIQVEANLTDSNYIAEIELLSKEEWEKELEDLFRVLSDESEDSNDDMLDIAVEKITMLYGADAHKKTLEELKKDDRFAEIETVLSVSKKTISNNDVCTFASDIAFYILQSESSPGGWYWPLVKSVTLKVPECHELLKHIVLVNVPGTGVYNKRDDKWKSTLRECSSVWIVSSINRAITDKVPWGILENCIEELGPGGECKSINFICTKTDDIHVSSYIRSARLTTDKISEDKDQKKMCILHRNEYAKKRVKEKFEKSEIKKIFNMDDHFLNVFTVSSHAFFDHTLNLEPSETEIPKLQDDLRILNKNISRELTRDYVNEAKGVLSLIQSLQLDADKRTDETKVYMELEKNLIKALNELDSHFDTIYIELEQCLSKGVDESVKSCVASTKEMISPNMQRGFHKILQALCRNGGWFFSKKFNIFLDLNKELAKHMQENTEVYFKQIFPVTGTTGKSVQEQIDKFSIIQNVSAYPKSSILHNIQNFIKTEEIKLKTFLKNHVVDMKKDIYFSIQKTICNEMSSCYEEAAAVRGAGSMKKRQELLITRVDSVKHDMFNKAKMEMLKKFSGLKLYINHALESGLKKSMELSMSKTSNFTLMDVSREIKHLERLAEQLSN
ncbi:nuclear GTPase SLIP-GC-like [Chanodichthys erythropterus]|uniref:nuclear GTPase SLIP-GC-like n=1 Tax=Chanodichthys erythropterus TaxID=933992 RepID=UPI00351EFB02